MDIATYVDVGVLHDITDGRAYKDLREKNSVGHDDVTLTVNTDGSPVLSSFGASLWPIQFIVSELIPHERFKHCTLAGLWFRKNHPNMRVSLENICGQGYEHESSNPGEQQRHIPDKSTCSLLVPG